MYGNVTGKVNTNIELHVNYRPLIRVYFFVYYIFAVFRHFKKI